jgi:hypothetical protein
MRIFTKYTLTFTYNTLVWIAISNRDPNICKNTHYFAYRPLVGVVSSSHLGAIANEVLDGGDGRAERECRR